MSTETASERAAISAAPPWAVVSMQPVYPSEAEGAPNAPDGCAACDVCDRSLSRITRGQPVRGQTRPGDGRWCTSALRDLPKCDSSWLACPPDLARGTRPHEHSRPAHDLGTRGRRRPSAAR